MTLDREKVDIILAKRSISITDLCKTNGISRNRIYTVMNSKKITPRTAGRFADALGVDVTEIIETDNK